MASQQLFPVFDVPSILAEDQTDNQKYKPSPLFDFEKGDFILNEANQVVYGSGYDAWVIWCTKTILTQRWAHLAYSSNAGIEMEESFAQSDIEAVKLNLERTITEALLADPSKRTQYVRDFEFSWESDSLHITCVVVGDDGDTATIKTDYQLARG